MSWDFWPLFFHDSNPSGPLTKRLKYFLILFRFRRIPPWSQTLCCASSFGVRLRGVHHTMESDSLVWNVDHPAESDSVVCITPQSKENKMSQKLGGVFSSMVYCTSLRGVSNLLSVGFDPKVYFSVMPEDINMKIRSQVTNCSRNLFYFLSFSKTELKGIKKYENTKTVIFKLVWPHGVHHTTKSSSLVCILRQSQAHTGVHPKAESKSKSLFVSGYF